MATEPSPELTGRSGRIDLPKV